MAFEKELEVARAAALQAGEIISAHYSRISEHQVDQKGHNDYVTVVDHESQRVIVEAIDCFLHDLPATDRALVDGLSERLMRAG